MCGRYTLRHQQMVENAFGASLKQIPGVLRRPRVNVSPGQMVIALRRAEGGHPVAEVYRWGIDAPWKKDGGMVINARAEKLQTSRLWRPLLENEEHRCLVPADGFYEWRAAGTGRPKQPFLFELTDGGAFAFAGLSRPAGDDEPAACAIVTCAANELVAGVHDRMPVMLAPGQAAAWLAGDAEEALAVALPLGSTAMRARPVTTAINSSRGDEPAWLDEHVTVNDSAAIDSSAQNGRRQQPLFGE